MKKILCVFLVFISLLLIPCQSMAENNVPSEADFETLSSLTFKETPARTRKQVDGLRMYVDEENPLFMIRNCPNWGCPSTGEAYAELAIKTYYGLPEDMRNFTVIYIDEGTTYFTPQEQIDFWDDLLTITDAHKVPVVLQSECFSTNKKRDPFTTEELSALFKAHETLIGFVQVELSTNGVTNEKLAYDTVTEDNGVNKNILARMKSCVQACAENGGLFIWQDMEYIYWKKTCYVNFLLQDKELYDLMKANTENIIIMDKHNGHGRHFSSQSNILGCWLDDVCGNWGVNLENFLWYEEGLLEYDDVGVAPNEPDFAYTAKYPPALYGIDMIADMVAGATVYAIEGTIGRGGVYQYIDGNVYFSPTMVEVLYPFYQMILNGSVPSKEQVKEKINVAFKMNIPATYALRGNEAHILQGLYADSFTLYQELIDFRNPYFDCTKDWVPSTGRYFVIPILPIHSDAKEVLPDSTIINDFTFWTKWLFLNPVKKAFFDEQYEETYSGDGVLFDINDYVYVFNSNEYKITDSEQSVSYTLDSGLRLNTNFVAHTYAIFKEDSDKLNIELCNLRLDSDDICAGLESEDEFLREYIFGGKRSDPKNFRTSVIELTGYETEPAVNAKGTNSAKMKTEWNESTKTLTLSIISNGEVNITVG